MTKIFAVVVTYNRPELVVKTIEAILSQTRLPDKVLVVDNASDTPVETIIAPHPLIVISRLNKNVGGAGGFHEGLKIAFESGADVVWMMDDDGVPDRECLATLFEKVGTKYVIAHPLVIDINNQKKLSFSQSINSKWINSVSDAISNSSEGIINGMSSPFNGTYMPRSVFDRIGNIKWECFIWGDEMEYILRAKSADIPILTVVNAIHLHPSDKREEKKYPVIGGILIPPSRFANIFYRNLGFVWWRYDKARFIVKGAVYLFHILFTNHHASAVEFLRYYLDGAMNRYSLSPSRKDLQI